eukprot:jgi/Chlat1/5622/Chrsp369S09002
MHSIERVCKTINVDALCSPEWKSLLSRVGDAVMQYLVTQASIFLPLNNGCYMQVTGAPIATVAQRLRSTPMPTTVQHKKPPKLAYSCREAQQPAPRKHMDGNINLRKRRASQSIVDLRNEHNNKRTKCLHHTTHAMETNMGVDASPEAAISQCITDMTQSVPEDEEVEQAVTQKLPKTPPEQQQQHNSADISPRAKRKRAGSRARKRAKHKREAAGHHNPTAARDDDGNDDTAVLDEDCPLPLSQDLPHSPCAPTAHDPIELCTQPEQSSQANTINQPMKKEPVVKPKSSATRATDIVIPRTGMLYAASFSAKPGLPRNHILNGGSSDQGSKKLYAAIFTASLPTVGTYAKQGTYRRSTINIIQGATTSAAPKPRNAKVLPLLDKMLCRAKKCAYGALLKHHCPMLETAFNGADSTEPTDEGYCTQDDTPDVEGMQDASASSIPCHPPVDTPVQRLVAACTPSQSVAAFVCSVLNCILPPELLGSQHNKGILFTAVRRFVALRRFEQLSLHQVMQGLKVSHVPWLVLPGQRTRVPASCHVFRQRQLQALVYWLLSGIVVPLLRAHFYATECEPRHLRIHFYRKPIWARLAALGTEEIVQNNYKPLAKTRARKMLSGRQLGFARVRLLPKKHSVRPILNLSKPMVAVFNLRRKGAGHTYIALRFPPINTVMADTFHCLRHEFNQLQSNDDYEDASVSDHHQIYKKLRPFLVHWKAVLDRRGGFYIVTCDVAKAFDTVQQHLLQAIVEPLLQQDAYHVQRYSTVAPHQTSAAPGVPAVRTRYLRAALPAVDECNDDTTACGFANLCQSAIARNTVFTAQAWSKCIGRGEVLSLLKEHIFRSLIKVGRTYYQQTMGIAQGSVLSSLLCNLFYSHLERTLLRQPCSSHELQEATAEPETAKEFMSCECAPVITPNVNDSNNNDCNEDIPAPSTPPQSASAEGSASLCHSHARTHMKPTAVLLRFIDDFLMISTSREEAASHVRRLHHGFPEYGFTVNARKTSLNFAVDVSGVTLPSNEYVGADGVRFVRWCGLLFNSVSAEVQADYSRYWSKDGSDSLSDMLTTLLRHSAGCELILRLRQYMRPKCLAILLDPRINSPSTIQLNIYQAFLLCAMKFHCYVVLMPAANVDFLYAAIAQTVSYLPRLVAQTVQAAQGKERWNRTVYKDTAWLGLRAFQRILTRKQSRHRQLLNMLDKQLGRKEYETHARRLAHVIADNRSSVFDKITY